MIFNAQWFQTHQVWLLLLLNHRCTRRWFRWVLCIRPCDAGHRRSIVALYPHAYVVLNETGASMTADIRTYDKFARRLYFAFRPLWWTLHAWDWLIADRWQPRWSFGFDTLTSYGLGSPKHGFVSRTGSNQTWDAAHDGAGNELDIPAEEIGTPSDSGSLLISSGFTSGYTKISRFIISFDTSLLGAGATVSAATCSLCGNEVFDDMVISPTIDLFRATPSDPNSLVAADFGECGDESQSTGGAFTEDTWALDGYNVFTLNALGRAHLNPTGLTSWSLRESTYDAPDVEPTAAFVVGSSGFRLYMPNRAGTTQDPKLVVTYVPVVSSYSTQVDIYGDVGASTWTKPAGARWVEIDLKAGGGGGGSGRKGAAGTIRCGGGGGGAGTFCAIRLPASALGATETITVGAGGAGGAVQVTDSTDGLPGASGEATTFGAWARANGGAGGEGGNTELTNGGDGYRSFPSFALADEGDGGLCASGDAGRSPANSAMRAGGGSGGGINVLDVVTDGGLGGTVGGAGDQSGYGGSILGGAGGEADGPGASDLEGSAGSDAPAQSIFGGGGGGGGAASKTFGQAGHGGSGGVPCGGGGGGGAAENGTPDSGSGGAGGPGLAIVVVYF